MSISLVNKLYHFKLYLQSDFEIILYTDKITIFSSCQMYVKSVYDLIL